MGTLCGHPTGDAEGWGPAGGHPALGTGGGAHAGHPMEGMDRGMCTPQSDGWTRNILGMWMHMRVSPLGGQWGGRRHSWVTPQREDGDIPRGIGGN